MDIINCFTKGNRYNLISTDDDSCDDITAAFIASGVRSNYKCIYYVDNLSFTGVEFFLKKYNFEITIPFKLY
jgi:hypothetical protein